MARVSPPVIHSSSTPFTLIRARRFATIAVSGALCLLSLAARGDARTGDVAAAGDGCRRCAVGIAPPGTSMNHRGSKRMQEIIDRGIGPHRGPTT